LPNWDDRFRGPIGSRVKTSIPTRRLSCHSEHALPQYAMVSKGSVSRGAFIVIEGLDRSGKTIQVERLEAQLSESGKKVKVLRFPGNPFPDTCFPLTPSMLMPSKLDRTTPIGQMINSYLQGKTDLEDHVIHLLFSANRWEVA
jgi:dTMP kinase